MGHMDADLVRPSRLQPQTHQGEIQRRTVQERPVAGAGRFSAWRHDPLQNGALLSGDGGVDDAFLRNLPFGDGQILSPDKPLFPHGGENGGGELVPGQDQQAGGVPVQPVDCPVYERFPLLKKIPGHPVGQSAGIMAGGRVNGNTAGLIYHQQVFILVDKVQIHRLRREGLGSLLLRKADGQGFPGSKTVRGKDFRSVHAKPCRRSLQAGNDISGASKLL